MTLPSATNVSGSAVDSPTSAAAEGLLELLTAADALRPAGNTNEKEVPAADGLEDQANAARFEQALAVGQASHFSRCSTVTNCGVGCNAALYQLRITLRCHCAGAPDNCASRDEQQRQRSLDPG
jgi:hypothetical protein